MGAGRFYQCIAQRSKESNPRVYAHTPFEGVDEELADGRILRVGDSDCEVIHAPGHSNDSICLYFARERVLFSGDTPLVIRTPGGSYDSAFIGVLERLAALPIDVIYSGHDEPVFRDVASLITETIKNVRKSRSK